MRHPASLDGLASGSVLSPPEPIAAKFGSSRDHRLPFEQLSEPKISERAGENTSVAAGRRKLWDFATHLHCSIIGTCLSTAELRHVLNKLGRSEAATASEHDLHASGVMVAGQRHEGAKLLHKALDRRHRVSINQFDKAKTPDEVRAVWKGAMQHGDIPGAYWAP
jgi:hypothetical protein